MSPNEHDPLDHPSAWHQAQCPVCNPNKTVPELAKVGGWPRRHMVVVLHFDRESFDALKELLQARATKNLGRAGSEESVTNRIEREALKRVFDQIRDVSYNDGT
jgi:predicted lipid-binding transport protein (Tim44 family)